MHMEWPLEAVPSFRAFASRRRKERRKTLKRLERRYTCFSTLS